MKVYLAGYSPREVEDEGKPVEPRYNAEVLYDFGYSKDPEWTMPPDVIGGELLMAQRLRPHVGAHYCEFEAEVLANGDSAIVCISHPD